GSTPMSWSLRRATLVLAAVTLMSAAAFLQQAHARKRVLLVQLEPPATTPAQPAPGGDSFEFAGLTLPKDNSLKSKVEAAVDYIKTEDWAEATRILQRLIDRPQDVFAQLPRTAPGGKEVLAWVSVK